MDFHEALGTRLLVTLLDWENAFDEVDQQKLLEALNRLSIHEKSWPLSTHYTQIRDSEQRTILGTRTGTSRARELGKDARCHHCSSFVWWRYYSMMCTKTQRQKEGLGMNIWTAMTCYMPMILCCWPWTPGPWTPSLKQLNGNPHTTIWNSIKENA